MPCCVGPTSLRLVSPFIVTRFMALYCRLFAPRPFLYIIVCNSASTLCFVRYLVDIIDMTDSEQNANLVLNCTWVSFFFQGVTPQWPCREFPSIVSRW